jgi:ribonuclease HI
MSTPRKVSRVVAAELLRAEMQLLDPTVRRDRDKVSAYLAADFFEFGKSGRAWSRQAILQELATETYTPPLLEGFACRFIAENVVLVTYRTVRINAKTGSREPALRSSLWSRQSGKWKLRFHQGTPALDLSSE